MQSILEKYSVDDFLNDDRFVSWVKGNHNSQEIWDAYRNANPANLYAFIEAQNLLCALLSIKEIEIPDNCLDEILGEINKTINESPKKIELFNYKVLRYAAAVLLPLLILSGILFFNSDKGSKKSFFMVDHNKATLILSDGSELSLDKSRNEIVNDASGVPVTLSPSIVSYEIVDKAQQNAYNTIVTPRGGEYKIRLSDGTEIWLNSETRLRYPTSINTKGDRVVFLEHGEAYFKVSKNKRAPFFVNLNGMQVKVLGTSFNINTFNKKIVTTLEEGSVEINRPNSSAILLKPGEQTVYGVSSKKLTKNEVDTYPYTSWRSGWLVFNDNSLEEVMEQVGRWYNLDVEYASDDIKNIRFGGKLKKSKNVQDILKVILQSNEIEAFVSDGKITISPKKYN